MEKKKNNSWKTILVFIIGVVLVALLVYWVMSNNDRSKKNQLYRISTDGHQW